MIVWMICEFTKSSCHVTPTQDLTNMDNFLINTYVRENKIKKINKKIKIDK